MSDPIDISKLPTFMLREIVAGETKLQPEEVMPGDTTRPDNAAPQGSEPPAGAAERPKLTMQEARELSADIARRAEERRKAAVALECTPPPQPPGGTPEGLRKVEHSMSCPFPEGCTCGASKFNAVNAALAAALAEVARLQGDKTNMLEELDVRGAEMQRLRAELEQTRRDRDNWKASAEVRAHERKIACERLTAAEERADGAEKERDQWKGRTEVAERCCKSQRASLDTIEDKLDAAQRENVALTAQRDTAIRERDEAKAIAAGLQRTVTALDAAVDEARKDTARLDILESAGDCTIEKDTRSIATSLLLNKEEYVAGCLRHCLDAALAAKTEGGERNL